MYDDESSSAPFTASKGRRFAFTLVLAFMLLGALLYWNERRTAAALSAGLGTLLLLLGLAVPAHLAPLETVWMALARRLSRITTPIFMAIVYFVVLTPTGVIRRVVGRSPLERGRRTDTYWMARGPSPDLEAKRRRMERQF